MRRELRTPQLSQGHPRRLNPGLGDHECAPPRVTGLFDQLGRFEKTSLTRGETFATRHEGSLLALSLHFARPEINVDRLDAELRSQTRGGNAGKMRPDDGEFLFASETAPFPSDFLPCYCLLPSHMGSPFLFNALPTAIVSETHNRDTCFF